MYYRARILVVDDEPSICSALRRLLTSCGYDVTTAYSGEDAQTKLMTEHFDVMMLDLWLKDVRGDVVYHIAMGAQSHLRHTTIFLTGDLTEKARNLVDPTGCFLLTKPWLESDLLEAIQSRAPRTHSASA
jgi:DNA-binding response OmpR family regulator